MNEAKFETLGGLAQMESKDIALLFYETGFDTFYTALSGCNESLRIAILKNGIIERAKLCKKSFSFEHPLKGFS